MDKKEQFLKRQRARRLNKFFEYNVTNFAWVASLVIAFVVFFYAYDFEAGFSLTGPMYFALLYLAAGLFNFLAALRIRSDVMNKSNISKSTRLMGIVSILFLMTGNLFSAVAGFNLIKEEKPLEYTLGFYAIINTFFIVLVSALNLFKEYVANSFFTGMYLLLGISLFYVVLIIMISKFTIRNGKYKRLLIPGILAILTGATGNIFAVILGFVVIGRIKNLNENKAVEWIDIMRRIFRNYMSILGLFFVSFLLSLSICSYLTFDYSIAIDNNYGTILLQPSLMFPFGTDEFGRCVFTRIVFGARISLVIGIISTVVPIIIGGILGAIAGHYGSRPDNIIMRTLDILYAVPSILLAIAIVAAFGANTMNLILALSIGMIPIYARTMRAQVMIVTSSEFVEAARACGRREWQILLKHIIPNSMAPIIVRATLSIGSAVLSTASLSYLGLGVEPHIPEWGSVLRGGSNFLETNSYLAIYPGIAIVLIVLAFNYLGDGVRDALDPKLK